MDEQVATSDVPSDTESDLFSRRMLARASLTLLSEAEEERLRGRLQEQAERSEMLRRDRMCRDLLLTAGSRYAHCTLDNYSAEMPAQVAVVCALREYVASLGERFTAREGLVIYGPVGTGKDHLALSVARESILRYGLHAALMRGQTFFGDVRDRMDSGELERDLLGSLIAPAILVVSDPLPPIGALTQHQAGMLYRLVEARYAANRLTICTINVASDSEAEDALGTPTWDRLCDGAWKVRCAWSSWRRPAREIG